MQPVPWQIPDNTAHYWKKNSTSLHITWDVNGKKIRSYKDTRCEPQISSWDWHIGPFGRQTSFREDTTAIIQATLTISQIWQL